MSSRILIIDDDKIDCEAIRRSILNTHPEATFRMAQTGAEGVRLIAEEKFGWIFVDYHLPDMDGLEILRAICDEQTGLTPAPTIVLTGQGNMSIMVEAIQYGAQDYLIKDNISPNVLDVALSKARHVYDLVHARLQAEQQLLQVQKMEAIGQLTGGIAHDFNNLLTIIISNTMLIEDMISGPEIDADQVRPRVSAVKKSAARGADLIRRLLMFSRQRNLSPSNTDILSVLKDIEELLQRSLGERIEIILEGREHLWPVFIDAGQLEHSLINLCVNARDAMPKGGTLSLKAFNFVVDEEFVANHADLSPGDYVLVEISDTGMGISPEVCEKIFDPFFTTKDVGKGTGLGLSVVYSFVKQSGGAIYVESGIDQGTTFRIFLPKTITAVDVRPRLTENLHNTEGGHETILLVEDEPEIRSLTKMLLREDGYNIIEAANGDEAIDILNNAHNHKHKVDLLFTDIVMPGRTTGLQLASYALDLHANIGIVFTTGYTKDSLPAAHSRDKKFKNQILLNKPYSPEQMRTAIRHVLDHQTSGMPQQNKGEGAKVNATPK